METDLPDPRLESEYNNRAKVPESAAIIAGWRQESAAFRASRPNAEIGLKYGPNARQMMDIFWPGSGRDVPLAMFIHGGYWQALDKDFFSHLAQGFLAHGIALGVPSYELCPHVSLAEIVEQIRAAAGYVMNRYHCDLYATGHSAGGHLTAMLLATDFAGRGVSGAIYGGYAISGLFDLKPLVQTSINNALKLDLTQARALSPLHLPAPGAKLHAYVGALEGEEYASQSRRIASAWRGRWGFIQGANHFTAIAPLTIPDSEMMKTIAASILKRQATRP